MEKMKVYMKVTDDKYELPIAVAESQAELAKILGITKSAVCRGIGIGKTYKTAYMCSRQVLSDQECEDCPEYGDTCDGYEP